MTDLTTKRAEEAERRYRLDPQKYDHLGHSEFLGPLIGGRYAALSEVIEEGWTPPAPVDPDLIEAREIVALEYDRTPNSRHHGEAASARAGRYDHGTFVQLTLAGIKRGRELGRASAFDNRVSERELGLLLCNMLGPEYSPGYDGPRPVASKYFEAAAAVLARLMEGK